MIKPFVVLVAICGFSANALEIKHFGNQEQIKADLVGKLADQDQSHFPEKSKLKHYLQLINDGCPHYLVRISWMEKSRLASLNSLQRCITKNYIVQITV